MKFLDWLLGPPLASSEEDEQRLGVMAGVPVLGLDALSSAAYGPEAALAMLLPLGALGLHYITPLMMVIVILLLVLYVSYRQTIGAYPQGGGSYIVAHKNLGIHAGLLAAASLLIDYVLNVAVGISAGVAVLVSAEPALHSHVLSLCLAILVLITVVNLRGIRSPGQVFAAPTYAFVGTLFIVLGLGTFKVLTGHATPVEAPPALPAAAEAFTWWLLIRAFASGCTAMTGVEAVSNGIQAFREPAVGNARRTLTVIVVILAIMLVFIALLSRAYHIGAMDPDQPSYQTVISQLTAAVVGRNWFYYLTQGSALAVLCLSANTSFADFPRLCRLIAEDEYLPRFFAVQGRRLVYSAGILILALMCGLIISAFGGVTERLIPLFAVGAFGAFTLSQAGMVVHWQPHKDEPHARMSQMINGIGAVCTGVALVVILVAKFAEGAWITMIFVPAVIYLFILTHRYYQRIWDEVKVDRPLCIELHAAPPVVLIPVHGLTRIAERAVALGLQLSPDVVAVSALIDEEDAKQLQKDWPRLVEAPARRAGLPVPRLRLEPSPYRDLVKSVVRVIRDLQEEFPSRMIMVMIPELAGQQWYASVLHNQAPRLLKSGLLDLGDPGVLVTDVPWYLKDVIAARAKEAALEQEDADEARSSVDAQPPAPRNAEPRTIQDRRRAGPH